MTQIRLAELIAARPSSVELVRFANSGSEAATPAVRIARRATGRRNLMFEGGYHGTSIPFADPDDEVVTVPFNDLSAAAKAIGADIAAVFAEPFLGAGGVIPADSGFLAPRDYREVAGTDVSLRRDLYLGLLDRGVYTTPRGMINLSTVMTVHVPKTASMQVRCMTSTSPGPGSPSPWTGR
jgi:glutamate-1-semialdehyde aminotransferase